MTSLGSDAHGALIEHVVSHYRDDRRVRSVAVFGSVSTGTWHELSDVDLDIVMQDGIVVAPAAEVAALFGSDAVIILVHADSADVVLGSLMEVSVRWHLLTATNPNIASTVRVAGGQLSAAEIIAAADRNRTPPDEQQLLDVMVRDAIGAWKQLQRGRNWDAVALVERMRRSLTSLRGHRDTMILDPADPASALDTVIAETAASCTLGPRRTRLLDQIGLAPSAADS